MSQEQNKSSQRISEGMLSVEPKYIEQLECCSIPSSALSKECLQCGFPMERIHCKTRCKNCGFLFECNES